MFEEYYVFYEQYFLRNQEECEDYSSSINGLIEALYGKVFVLNPKKKDAKQVQIINSGRNITNRDSISWKITGTIIFIIKINPIFCNIFC